MRNNNLKKLILSGLFIALAIILPFLTGQIPFIGNFFLPMHIPALIAGFVCGPIYGAVVGFSSPLLRSLIFSMPPLFPVSVNMAFEMLVYGLVAGVLYSLSKKDLKAIYFSLVISMLAGRVVWGISAFITSKMLTQAFTIELFLAEAFINAWGGILIHIAIIPPIVMALHRAKLIEK